MFTNRHTKKDPAVEIEEKTIIVTGTRTRKLCTDCFTEHAGPCW
jgi:hypothetical protein